MPRMILLFSHQLNEKQKREAEQVFGIDEFVSLPKNLQHLWSNIPTDVESIIKFSEPIKTFLLQNSSSDDVILVQGDFGMVYNIVKFCKKNTLIPVYATTTRDTIEYKEGDKMIKKSIFTFRRFREYA